MLVVSPFGTFVCEIVVSEGACWFVPIFSFFQPLYERTLSSPNS